MTKNIRKIIGDFGEGLACDYLEKKGYKIIDRNVKISFQEIDVVSMLNDEIIFVEVKTRTSKKFDDGENSVFGRKIKHLETAISKYLAINKLNVDKFRVDLISIEINKTQKIAKIKHYFDII